MAYSTGSIKEGVTSMLIETVGLKGNHAWYEDALVQNISLSRYGVLDGATSLVPYEGKNGETGAYLAAHIEDVTIKNTINGGSLYTTLTLHTVELKF